MAEKKPRLVYFEEGESCWCPAPEGACCGHGGSSEGRQMADEYELVPLARQILKHSLTGGTNRVYRNYFAADPATVDGLMCMRLGSNGLMVKGRTTVEGLVYFHVTQAGAEAVGLRLPHE